MLLEFDDDQRYWRDTVRDVLAKECAAPFVRSVVEDGVDPTPLWQTFVSLGWTEFAEPSEMIELAIVLEELGRATDPTPFLATMTHFAPFAPGRHDKAVPATGVLEGVTAVRDGADWKLTGTAHYVLDGDRAETLAVVTPSGVFVVPGTDVIARRAEVFDPVLHIADVTFDAVRVSDADRVKVDVVRARHIALTGMALTMVGACQRILDMVLEHVRTRHQFGVPIGSFQAVAHKTADMHVAIERARALAYFAALTISEDDPRRGNAAAMAKAAAGECQSLVFRHGLQSFGAMGFTWENDVQFALKRAKAGELLLGGAAYHRARIAEAALVQREADLCS